MSSYGNLLKVVKCIKLQFDTFGYAAFDGKIIYDRGVYRSLLRSGKTEKKVSYTSDRGYQTIEIYNNYFRKHTNKNRPSNKQMIHCALKHDLGFKPNKHYKSVLAVTKNLLKHKYLIVTFLPNDCRLLEDSHNNLKYYYNKNDELIYRLINGNCYSYN